MDRGALKCSQLRVHEGVRGPSAAHGRCVDRLEGLPTKPASGLCSWGHLAAPGNRFAPLLHLDGEEGRRARAPGARGLLSRGRGFAPPTPSPDRRRARRPCSSTVSFSSPALSRLALKGRPGQLGSSQSAVDVRRCSSPVSPLAGRPGELCSSLAARRDTRVDGLEDLPVALPVSVPQAGPAMQAPPGILWRPTSGRCLQQACLCLKLNIEPSGSL